MVDDSLNPSRVRVQKRGSLLLCHGKADLASEHKLVGCFPLPSLWEKLLNTEMLEAAVAGMLVNLPAIWGVCTLEPTCPECE